MDATGLNALEDLYERLQARGKHIVLSGPHTQPLFMMDKAGFLDRLGRENVCANIELSLARSREILGLPPAPPADLTQAHKLELEAARQNLAQAFKRADEALGRAAGRAVTSPGSLGGSGVQREPDR
jgi:SulP family sulfate permease